MFSLSRSLRVCCRCKIQTTHLFKQLIARTNEGEQAKHIEQLTTTTTTMGFKVHDVVLKTGHCTGKQIAKQTKTTEEQQQQQQQQQLFARLIVSFVVKCKNRMQ